MKRRFFSHAKHSNTQPEGEGFPLEVSPSHPAWAPLNMSQDCSENLMTDGESSADAVTISGKMHTHACTGIHTHTHVRISGRTRSSPLPPPPTGAPANANHLPGLWEEQSRHGSFAEHLTVSWGAGFLGLFLFPQPSTYGQDAQIKDDGLNRAAALELGMKEQ